MHSPRRPASRRAQGAGAERSLGSISPLQKEGVVAYYTCACPPGGWGGREVLLVCVWGGCYGELCLCCRKPGCAIYLAGPTSSTPTTSSCWALSSALPLGCPQSHQVSRSAQAAVGGVGGGWQRRRQQRTATTATGGGRHSWRAPMLNARVECRGPGSRCIVSCTKLRIVKAKGCLRSIEACASSTPLEQSTGQEQANGKRIHVLHGYI